MVIYKDNNGWWKGSLNGKIGLFLGSYFKEVLLEVDFEKSKFFVINFVLYIFILER